MTKRITAPSDSLSRIMPLLNAFEAAPPGADIDMRVGRSAEGRPAIMVSVSGGDYPIFADEARKIAEIMEGAMRRHPHHPDSAALPDMILSLRAAADRSDDGVSQDKSK